MAKKPIGIAAPPPQAQPPQQRFNRIDRRRYNELAKGDGRTNAMDRRFMNQYEQSRMGQAQGAGRPPPQPQQRPQAQPQPAPLPPAAAPQQGGPLGLQPPGGWQPQQKPTTGSPLGGPPDWATPWGQSVPYSQQPQPMSNFLPDYGQTRQPAYGQAWQGGSPTFNENTGLRGNFPMQRPWQPYNQQPMMYAGGTPGFYGGWNGGQGY